MEDKGEEEREEEEWVVEVKVDGDENMRREDRKGYRRKGENRRGEGRGEETYKNLGTKERNLSIR